MNALEIRGLSKSFGNFKLENIDLKLEEGFILGYVGQNGAGKTTTIKLIMEQLKRDSGEIRVFGKRYKDDATDYKNLIGYIADDCYFPGNFTVKDIMHTLKDFYKDFDEHKFISYLKRWDLPDNKKVKGFSKGMKIKLMFASVFARQTRLLILDEPTSGLDPVIRSEILELLQEYISDGKKSVLFSTHNMTDLEKIADYIYFINDGKTVFCDTKDNVLETYLLAKGGTNDLTPEVREKLIGYKKSRIGFEGLIHSSDRKSMGDGILLEKPSVDDIVVFYINGLREGF